MSIDPEKCESRLHETHRRGKRKIGLKKPISDFRIPQCVSIVNPCLT